MLRIKTPPLGGRDGQYSLLISQHAVRATDGPRTATRTREEKTATYRSPSTSRPRSRLGVPAGRSLGHSSPPRTLAGAADGQTGNVVVSARLRWRLGGCCDGGCDGVAAAWWLGSDGDGGVVVVAVRWCDGSGGGCDGGSACDGAEALLSPAKRGAACCGELGPLMNASHECP